MELNGDNLFNGKFTIEQAIEKLRTRLLDLSSRNRLISFRHSKGRSIQFVNEPNLASVFDRLIDGKSILLKHVPNPPVNTFNLKRPDAKAHANTLGINTNEEFIPLIGDSTSNRHSSKIQTLLYPDDLEKHCRKIRAESRTIIEETGTNMLYLVFGFLEYFDSADSIKPMLAPLLSVPVVLDRNEIDPESRTYQYSLNYSGEDVQDNQSLREKLSQEFTLQLPIFDEEDNPISYLASVQKAVTMQQRWKVRYQLSLSFLSFGKLAIWADLDPYKSPKLAKHPLLNKLFSGGSNESVDYDSKDYEIDKHPEADKLSLIYDADSAQHSAIIDVLSGKNRVINGPPGTGKSQTITNIIAAALQRGMTVLFVSEKLAALEVVRHRLNQANLGDFCLELHSHKTQKKKLLEDVLKRLTEKYSPDAQVPNKLIALNRLKKSLNRYAEIMSSRIGNEMGLTVHEVIWRTERFRGLIEDISNSAPKLYMSDASSLTLDEVEYRRTKMEVLGQLLTDVGPFNATNPWWGFTPSQLAPGDEIHIHRIVTTAYQQSNSLWQLVEEYMARTLLSVEPRMDYLLSLCEEIKLLPTPPENLLRELLPRVFLDEKVGFERNQTLIKQVIHTVKTAQKLNTVTERVLAPNSNISYDQLKELFESADAQFSREFFLTPISQITKDVSLAYSALTRFDQLNCDVQFAYAPIEDVILSRLRDIIVKIESTGSLRISSQSFNSIKAGLNHLTKEVNRFLLAFEKIEQIANLHRITFAGTPDAIKRLAIPGGIDGTQLELYVDDAILASVKGNVNRIPEELASLSITDLHKRQRRLTQIQERISEILRELQLYAEQVSLPFNNSVKATNRLVTVCEIMDEAPKDLLNYRHPSIGHPQVAGLLEKAEQMQQEERVIREALVKNIYLDNLPDEEKLKSLLGVFRRLGDRFFNFLNKDWRTGKEVLASISKNPLGKKSIDFQRTIERILQWKEYSNKFVLNQEFKSSFGPLFNGVETDFSNVHRLHSWYINSQLKLRKYPELIGLIDLSTIDYERLMEFDALYTVIKTASESLVRCQEDVNQQLGSWAKSLPTEQLDEFQEAVSQSVQSIDKLILSLQPLVKSELSPKRAVEVLSAVLQFSEVSSDFETIQEGTEVLKKRVEPLLPGISEIQFFTWSDYLAKLKILEKDISYLTELASPYQNWVATPEKLRNFMEAKLEVDYTSKAVAAQFDNIPVKDWITYSSRVQERVTIASKLISGISPAAISSELSVREVREGLFAKKETQKLLQETQDDSTLTQLLQEVFKGLQTDLAAISDTLAWGNLVASKSRIFNSELKALLLGVNPAENLFWVKEKLDTALGLLETVETTLLELNSFGIFSWIEWTRTPFETKLNLYASELAVRAERAVSKNDTILGWAQYHSERREIHKLGLQHFVLHFEQQSFPANKIASVFNFSIYWSIGRDFYTKFPEFIEILGSNQDTLRAEFASLDQEIISLTGRTFAYQIDKLKKPPFGRASGSPREKTELSLLLHEIGKTKQHIPIRQLLKRAGQALQTIKPCFMMGPLSVAQYLEQGALEFDLVVMDEASQLRPEEALGAIARGKQLVVVGDPKQLPPTNFFDRVMEGVEDEEDDAAAIFAGSESILDICQQLFHPVRTLRWHYRSQHESLIAFSNHHFYEGRLIVFPSPFDRNKRLGVRYRYVKLGVYNDRKNVLEANRVVDAVLEHMINFPDESLGVVTLNQTQRDLIEELLESKIRNVQETTSFITKWESEGWPFFVKNLENVQGDERDVIFISTTFGKALGTDKVRQNFGPISRQDGWRRLNVLFTRARRRVELYTSMLPEDIIVEEKTSFGTKALRNYLDFVKRGVLTTTSLTGREPDSDFEIAVGDMLRNKGYEVVPQLGVAGFFIDLAVRNPDRPGEFLAAIECDGATYHSSKSARDRDRIRQSILESLGWKGRLWRIWSTDWFYNPRQSSEHLLDFLEERRKTARLTPLPDLLIDEDDTVLGTELEELLDEPVVKSRQELSVEIGDQVLYCFTDKPYENRSVQLIEGPSDPMMQRFNDQSPLGKALLDAKVGDVKLIENKGVSREIRLVQIKRG